MKESVELIGLILGIMLIIALMIAVVLGIISLPLAFIGWAVLTVINLFIPTATSYLIYVAVGIATSLLANLIRVVLK